MSKWDEALDRLSRIEAVDSQAFHTELETLKEIKNTMLEGIAFYSTSEQKNDFWKDTYINAREVLERKVAKLDCVLARFKVGGTV